MKNGVWKLLLVILFVLAIVFGTLFIIDTNRMKNNKPVLFSTWGKKYSAPVASADKMNAVLSLEDKIADDTVWCGTFNLIWNDLKNELAKKDNGKWQTKVGRDILFIERNLNFLKPGGRMAVVLPQGRFNNSSDKYIREFITERCRILAVVGLHGNVFKPHTGTKTSVLFVQKWDDKLCPKKDDYPIFFATMQKPSKDNSGEKIYVKDADGEILLDRHNHFIVDHDLYNHDGMTQDGIAEAFAEFAKKEGLSFFQ